MGKVGIIRGNFTPLALLKFCILFLYHWFSYSPRLLSPFLSPASSAEERDTPLNEAQSFTSALLPALSRSSLPPAFSFFFFFSLLSPLRALHSFRTASTPHWWSSAGPRLPQKFTIWALQVEGRRLVSVRRKNSWIKRSCEKTSCVLWAVLFGCW